MVSTVPEVFGRYGEKGWDAMKQLKSISIPDGSLVYLATPYSHADDQVMHDRFVKACEIAAHLISSGIHVFSPIAHTHPIKVSGRLRDGGWEFWKRYDELMLSKCDILIVWKMDGWKESVGVTAEIEYARKIGLPIFFVDESPLHSPVGMW